MSMIVAMIRAIVLMVVTVAMVVIAVMVMVMVMVVIVAMVGYIAWFVFLRSHEVHRPVAGVVFVAMLAPIFGVSWRHVQVHRRRWISLRHNQHRLRIDERRRPFAANLNLAVYARRDLAR